MNVYRDDLIAIYLGQTEIKTQKFIDNNPGKTFIIYNLVFNDLYSYGKEALSVLNRNKVNFELR